MQRSLAVLRLRFPLVQKVEVWNGFAHKRQDLWGFDIACAGSHGFTLVQVTDDAHLAEHRANLMTSSDRAHLAAAGVKMLLHSWGLHGPAGKRKVWTLKEETL
jgi:hypothetical protein